MQWTLDQCKNLEVLSFIILPSKEYYLYRFAMQMSHVYQIIQGWICTSSCGWGQRAWRYTIPIKCKNNMKLLLLIFINSITRTHHITVCECSFETAYLHSDTCELQDLDCFIFKFGLHFSLLYSLPCMSHRTALFFKSMRTSCTYKLYTSSLDRISSGSVLK